MRFEKSRRPAACPRDPEEAYQCLSGSRGQAAGRRGITDKPRDDGVSRTSRVATAWAERRVRHNPELLAFLIIIPTPFL